MSPPTFIQVDGLRVELGNGTPIVEDIDLSITRGQIVGLVGESGSGKTTMALALLGYAKRGVGIAAGRIRIGEHEILGRTESAIRSLRGRVVSYVPQDPGSRLDPSFRIEDQIAEMRHSHRTGGSRPLEAREALRRVNLPGDRDFARRFPHQLSGGQQQRIAIAIALVCEPAFVVLDEPATGLDVITQGKILEEVDRLRRETSTTFLYVTHDVAAVAQIADRIAVMYAGRIVEEGPARQILSSPRHPYTLGLVSSVPDHTTPRRLRGIPGVAVGVGERPAGCAFAPRCFQRVSICEAEMPELDEVIELQSVRCFEWQRTPSLALEAPRTLGPRSSEGAPLLTVDSLVAVHTDRSATVVAARNVSFKIKARECLALVGESGSGKTTIARCVAGLHSPTKGQISFDGLPLAPRARQRTREQRRRIQIIFQNPDESLNPRHRIEDTIARPARIFRELSRRDARMEARALLERVRLPVRLADRFPTELSGGERQRVAIARALAARPDLIVCDEITSALDVSVQAAVLELLEALRAEFKLSLLLVSHDLGVVASVADRVAVLANGSICEQGSVENVLRRPSHDYTQKLLAAAPRVTDGAEIDHEAAAAVLRKP
jgi:peptide/nickel transport system ATP-binding protein